MKRAILLVLLGLGACVQEDPGTLAVAEVLRGADAICRARGYTSIDPGYKHCRNEMGIALADMQLARLNRPAPIVVQQAAAQPTSCTSVVNLNMVTTNCY